MVKQLLMNGLAMHVVCVAGLGCFHLVIWFHAGCANYGPQQLTTAVVIG
jgi:hypothetical protein